MQSKKVAKASFCNVPATCSVKTAEQAKCEHQSIPNQLKKGFAGMEKQYYKDSSWYMPCAIERQQNKDSDWCYPHAMNKEQKNNFVSYVPNAM